MSFLCIENTQKILYNGNNKTTLTRRKTMTNPIANKNAVIRGDKYRFTVLTDRLLRLEYDEDGIFEDRATQ